MQCYCVFFVTAVITLFQFYNCERITIEPSPEMLKVNRKLGK